MNTDEHGWVGSKALSYAVIGCAMEVLNTLGHGLNEKPYENALAVELRLQGIPFVQQARFDVLYKGVRVGEYIPDLLVGDEIVVDTKSIQAIGDADRGQMVNYLRITRRKVGLILNFGSPKLHWDRIVL
jgi:GxxExxY protein